MEACVVAFGDRNFRFFLRDFGELDRVISFMKVRLNLHRFELR